MRFVHLMFNSVFCGPIVSLMDKYFGGKDLHTFFIRENKGYACALPIAPNVFHINRNIIENEPNMLQVLRKAKRIILHGMFHDDYISLLLRDKSVAQKTTWIVWGGDLTDLDPIGPRGELAKLFEVVSTSRYDYADAVEKYGVTGKHKDYVYPSMYKAGVLESAYAQKKKGACLQHTPGQQCISVF